MVRGKRKPSFKYCWEWTKGSECRAEEMTFFFILLQLKIGFSHHKQHCKCTILITHDSKGLLHGARQGRMLLRWRSCQREGSIKIYRFFFDQNPKHLQRYQRGYKQASENQSKSQEGTQWWEKPQHIKWTSKPDLKYRKWLNMNIYMLFWFNSPRIRQWKGGTKMAECYTGSSSVVQGGHNHRFCVDMVCLVNAKLWTQPEELKVLSAGLGWLYQFLFDRCYGYICENILG